MAEAFDISKICRVCMAEFPENPVEFSTNVFFEGEDETKINISVNECYTECTAVEIEMGEVEISKLCVYCYKELEAAYIFRKRAQKANDDIVNTVYNCEVLDEEYQQPEQEIKSSPKSEVVQREKKTQSKPRLQHTSTFNPLSLPDEVEMQKFNIDFEHEVPQFLEDTTTKSLWVCGCAFPNCTKRFKKDLYYKMHYIRDHLKESIMFSCNLCTFNTANVSVILYHSDTHNVENIEYRCEHCPTKTFRHKRAYLDHMRNAHSHVKKKNLTDMVVTPDITYQKKRGTSETSPDPGPSSKKVKIFVEKLPPTDELTDDEEPEDENDLFGFLELSKKDEGYEEELENQRKVNKYSKKKYISEDEEQEPAEDENDHDYVVEEYDVPNTSLNNKYTKIRDKLTNKIKILCQTCGSSFATRENYNIHYTIQHMKTTTIKVKKSQLPQNDESDYEEVTDKVKETNATRRTMTCKHCQEVMQSDFNLIKHMREVHSIDRVFKCEICSRRFLLRNNLSYHQRNGVCLNLVPKSGVKKTKETKTPLDRVPPHAVTLDSDTMATRPMCSECGKTFSNNSNYKTHYVKAHLDDIQPTESLESLEEIQNVDESMGNVKAEGDYVDGDMIEVDLGPVSSTGVPQPEKVFDVVANKSKFMCRICKKMFRSVPTYQFHFVHKHLGNTQNDEGSYIETIDNEASPSKKEQPKDNEESDMEEVSTENNKRVYNCKHCTAEIIGELKMLRHMKTLHGVHRPFKCSVCGKRFNLRTNWKAHLKHHPQLFKDENGQQLVGNDDDNWREYVDMHCEECHDSPDVFAFARHVLQVHEVEKPFKCLECNFKSARTQLLFFHIDRAHTNVVHQCDECGALLRSKRALLCHMKTGHHTQEKRVCSTCGETFVNETLLRHHHKVEHLGLKPASCLLCDKEFTRIDACRDHIIASHIKFSISCDLCSASSATKKRLKHHYNKHHRQHVEYLDKLKSIKTIQIPDVEEHVFKNPAFFDA